MILFNLVLILHFIAFLWYVGTLASLFRQAERRLYRIGLPLGITILVTGLMLVALKYPSVNYYKVVPKMALFVGLSVLNGIYSRRLVPGRVYGVMLGMTVLAALIAVVKV